MSFFYILSSCHQPGENIKQAKSYMSLDTSIFNNIYTKYKEKSLTSRRFKHSDIIPLIDKHRDLKELSVKKIGDSFQGRSISELSFGQGKIKVMLWSQMHGDEPTATMALFDLFNFLSDSQTEFQAVRELLKRNLNIHFIPMLNPDGAERYTRRTAQGIDMNRDARATQTVEGSLLRSRAKDIQPNFGFNLHDQNIYYNVPGTKNPVTISLLAPAYNQSREINQVRGNAMKLAAGMHEILQQYIPNAVAKYDDTYSPRGFGDNFQSWNASTVLIESGGLKNDPEKQYIRKLNFIIILNALLQIADGSYSNFDIKQYEEIPFNASQLHDVVLRDVEIQYNSQVFRADLAIRRSEITVERDFYVRGVIEDIGDLKDFYGYHEIESQGLKFIPAKVSPDILEDFDSFDKHEAFELLKQGYMAVKIRNSNVLKTGSLHHLPIHILTKENIYFPIMADFGGFANFFLADQSGNLKFAIMNGYVIDLENESKISSTEFKNRVL